MEGAGAGLEASWAVLGDPKRLWRHLGLSWRRLGSFLGGLGLRKVAKMVPIWLPERSQNQLKINPKIDQIFNASWNLFLEGFWLILDAKMKQS